MEKEGGKEKPITINLPIRHLPNIANALKEMYDAFQANRTIPTVEDLFRLKERADKKHRRSIDLAGFGAFRAPSKVYKLDSYNVIAGETVQLPKGNFFGAISFVRLPKEKMANGKIKPRFTLSYPLRYLPVLDQVARFGMKWLNVPE